MVSQVWRGEVKNLEVEFLQDLPVSVRVCVCVYVFVRVRGRAHATL